MVNQVEMELSFQGESAEEMKAILNDAGANDIETREDRGLLAIGTVMVGFLVIEEVAKLVSKLVRAWKCGVVVVVNADGGKVSTEKNCDLPRGTVLLVHPDGTQMTLQEPTEPQVGSWFKEALKAFPGKG